MKRNIERVLGALALTALATTALTACDSGAASDYHSPNALDRPQTPDQVSFEELSARLTPSSGERALLVNFWASW